MTEPVGLDHTFVFDARTRELTQSTIDGAPHVIDSFLVDDGLVRALDRHLRRFAMSCAARAGVQDTAVGRFALAAVEAIPSTGQWFPRLELVDLDCWRLAVRVRPAPPRRATAKVWLGAVVPSRVAPKVKGPDVATMSGLRDAARAVGADEALVCGPTGDLLETSQSNVLWWRGDVLCTVPDDACVLPGITRELVLELAAADGYEIRRERVRPAALDGLEVWLVNALHGVRSVSEWIGRPGASSMAAPGNASRALAFRRRLNATARPIR